MGPTVNIQYALSTLSYLDSIDIVLMQRLVKNTRRCMLDNICALNLRIGNKFKQNVHNVTVSSKVTGIIISF